MEAAAGKMRYSRHRNPGRILAAPAATLRFLFPVFVAVSPGACRRNPCLQKALEYEWAAPWSGSHFNNEILHFVQGDNFGAWLGITEGGGRLFWQRMNARLMGV